MVSVNSYVACPRVLVGGGARAEIGALAAGLKARRALIVADPALAKLGVSAELADRLARHGLGAAVFDGVAPNPTVGDIDRCSAAARAEACDLIVGLGGGSALDVAKGAALTAREGMPFSALVRGDERPAHQLPKILLPSTSGSGSEVSQAIVVTDEAGRQKMGLHAPWVVADAAIVDPDLAASMPPAVTADTGLDALTHGIEALLARNSSPPSDALAAQACACVWRSLPAAYTHGDDPRARMQMCEGSLLAGMAFTWAGLGAVHALAYPLTLRHGLSHGRANAVMLPHVLSHTFAVVPAAAGRVAAALGFERRERCAADEVIAALAAFVERLGVTVRLRDAGVAKDETAQMASNAIATGGRLLATNPCALSEDDALRIYDDAW